MTTTNIHNDTAAAAADLYPCIVKQSHQQNNVFIYWEGPRDKLCTIFENIMFLFSSQSIRIHKITPDNMVSYLEAALVSANSPKSVKSYVSRFIGRKDTYTTVQRANILKIFLLYLYGGIWISPDVLFLRPLSQLFECFDDVVITKWHDPVFNIYLNQLQSNNNNGSISINADIINNIVLNDVYFSYVHGRGIFGARYGCEHIRYLFMLLNCIIDRMDIIDSMVEQTDGFSCQQYDHMMNQFDYDVLYYYYEFIEPIGLLCNIDDIAAIEAKAIQKRIMLKQPYQHNTDDEQQKKNDELFIWRYIVSRSNDDLWMYNNYAKQLDDPFRDDAFRDNAHENRINRIIAKDKTTVIDLWKNVVGSLTIKSVESIMLKIPYTERSEMNDVINFLNESVMSVSDFDMTPPPPLLCFEGNYYSKLNNNNNNISSMFDVMYPLIHKFLNKRLYPHGSYVSQEDVIFNNMFYENVLQYYVYKAFENVNALSFGESFVASTGLYENNGVNSGCYYDVTIDVFPSSSCVKLTISDTRKKQPNNVIFINTIDTSSSTQQDDFIRKWVYLNPYNSHDTTTTSILHIYNKIGDITIRQAMTVSSDRSASVEERYDAIDTLDRTIQKMLLDYFHFLSFVPEYFRPNRIVISDIMHTDFKQAFTLYNIALMYKCHMRFSFNESMPPIVNQFILTKIG